jgi:hypothetical protein
MQMIDVSGFNIVFDTTRCIKHCMNLKKKSYIKDGVFYINCFSLHKIQIH